VFSGKCAIVQTGSGSGYWQVNISNFNDPGGNYDATDIQSGDYLYFTDNGTVFSLEITSIVNAGLTTATIRVSNANIVSLVAIPTTNNAFISRRTIHFKFVPYISNITDNENQLADEYNMYKIDSILESFSKKQDVVSVYGDLSSLQQKIGDLAFVINATGDSTVETGSAVYMFDSLGWVKISELDKFDFLLELGLSNISDSSFNITLTNGSYVEIPFVTDTSAGLITSSQFNDLKYLKGLSHDSVTVVNSSTINHFLNVQELTSEVRDSSITSQHIVSTGVVAGTYGDPINIPSITIDEDGRITSASNVSLSFNSNRNILRLYQVGTNVGGNTVNDMLEWMYFAPPTITCNLSPTTTVYEVGTTNSITISGSVSNPGNATLSNGALTRTVPASNVVNPFGSATSYTSTISFTPTKNASGDYNLLSYSFRATQDWVKNAESGTATSVTRTVTAVYPVLYGMSATDLSQVGNPYTELTKLVQTEGDKTVTFTGTSQYMYYAVPKTWSDYDLSQIIDHNGFNVTPSFDAYDVIISSSGLSNNWVQEYKLYKLNTLTNAQGFAYQFIR
jgi:hypothetical protein